MQEDSRQDRCGLGWDLGESFSEEKEGPSSPVKPPPERAGSQ
jgi:hypothetical protein